MKPNIALTAAVALLGGFLSSCGGDDSGAVTSGNGMQTGSVAVTSHLMDTAQVLAQARETSEAAEPYAVNDGALTFTDTSDTTEPIAINAP